MKLSKSYIAIVVCAVGGVAAMFLTRGKSEVRRYVNEGIVWTTEYHITYDATRDLNDSVQRIFSAVDLSASVYNEQSLVSALNAGKVDTLDAYLRLLYTKSVEVNKASGGVFDPTVRPLVSAWGVGRKSGTLPDAAQIDSIMAFVGIGKTSLNGNRLVKADSRVQFDFSSIAKGMACDEVARLLARNGAENFIVEIGGEVVCGGESEPGKPWRVSVDMPTEDSTAAHVSALTLGVTDLAVATSGNYRRYRETDEGKRVSHIIDPLTGHSEDSNLLSVTIVAADCMTADAWATACMVMGTEKVISMFEHDTSFGVMTISTNAEGDFVVWSNKRFAELVISQNNS